MLGIIKLLLTVIILFLSVFILFITKIFFIKVDSFLFKTWAKLTIWINGIEIIKLSTTKNTPSIIISNHISYWDIIVYASLYKTYFVSKASVKHWPIIGWGARIVKTIFIERTDKAKAGKILNDRALNVIKNNDNILMFPEGTTSREVLPFRMGAFKLAKRLNTEIKPVAIYYNMNDEISWVGTDTFIPHLIKTSFLKNIKCYIYELDQINPNSFETASHLKDYCHKIISEKFNYIKDNIVLKKQE
jgi:1-acyl-sn-glycerol-3-phosphate acyltransferase